MKYVVLDLEMCKVPKSLRNETYRWCYETIQIGAVLLDENYDVKKKFSTFVRPEYGSGAIRGHGNDFFRYRRLSLLAGRGRGRVLRGFRLVCCFR